MKYAPGRSFVYMPSGDPQIVYCVLELDLELDYASVSYVDLETGKVSMFWLGSTFDVCSMRLA